MMSVSDLNKECDRLLELADSIERIDVYSRVKTIRKLKDNMNNAFTSDEFDEVKVSTHKESLNKKLIELEEILSMYDVTLKKRHDERIKIYVLKKWYTDRLSQAVLTKDSNELLEFCLNMARVSKCYRIASDIVYSNDDVSFSFIPKCEEYCNMA